MTAHDAIRSTRGAFVHAELKAERWSIRSAALAIGTSHTALGARVKGEIPFSAEEIESLAHLLKRDPIDFYAAYLRAGEDDHAGPRPGGGAGLRNVYMLENPGLSVKVRQFAPDHTATITPLFRTAV